MKTVELRRHTDNDGDALSPEGIAAAHEIGARLIPPYDAFVSTGAARATQTLQIWRAAVAGTAEVEEDAGLRSEREDRWRAAYQAAGSGALDRMRESDPDLVELDSVRLGAALGRVFDRLPEGGRALVVGHSPTNEAAVLGLTGQLIGPLGKGEGVLVVADGADYRVQPLSPR
ncbi:hypothetical protein BH20ACT5_BH20ACT5_09620 [soil metagenome]